MPCPPTLRGLDEVLQVMRRLATPFDLHSMPAAVTAAARQMQQDTLPAAHAPSLEPSHGLP